MKGDFSRITFDPVNNFSQVLLQQGRVLLDSDFNELAGISAYRLRQLARDVFGPHAGPVNAAGKTGFFIDVSGNSLQVGPGRYYVDGQMIDNLAAVKYKPGDLGVETGALHLLYLDVWERHVSWLESDGLSDPALGGPDTATRAQVVWQVRAFSLKDETQDVTKINWVDWLGEHFQRWPRTPDTGRPFVLPQMQAWTDSQTSDDDIPCVADPAGGYRGLENQLYRVEIHTPGDPATNVRPTFKWSRENGSVTGFWQDVEGDDLLVEGIHDTSLGFAPGQWVELTSLDAERLGQPGVMVRLAKVEGLRLTMDRASASGSLPDLKKLDHPVVRRWDQRESRSDRGGFKDGAVELDETREFYTLEAGINIAFRPLPAGAKGQVRYRTGDYWLIPARPAIGDILWQQDPTAAKRDRYLPLEPRGVEHSYAPLALVQVDAAGKPSLSGKSLLRKYVPPVSGF